MAHPDATRQGNEKGQREHAGRDSEATDAGVQRDAQNLRGAGPHPADDAGGAGAGAGAGTEGGGAAGTPASAHAGGGEAGAGGEATLPPGESRALEGHPALADRGLQASSPGPAAAGAPGASRPR